MKSKFVLSIFLCLLTGSAYNQSFFKGIPKPTEARRSYSAYSMELAPVAAMDSSLNVFRPIANIAAYAEPGNILMAGAGISYQHLKYDYVAAKWNCLWSISGIMWAGGSVAPSTPAQAISYGLMFGVLNNLFMVGPAINGNKVIATVAIGISLNN